MNTYQPVQDVSDDPRYVTYCSFMERPGLRAWMTEIEYTKFRPGTLNNDDFHVAVIKWPEGLLAHWLVIIFHKSEQQFAESILWKNGLRKVPEGFTQMVMSPSASPEERFPVDVEELKEKGSLTFNVGKPVLEKFPIQGPNVFFLENHSKGGSNVVYTNDPEKMKAASKLEDAQCQVFFDEHDKWLSTPEGQAAMQEYIKEHPDGRNL